MTLLQAPSITGVRLSVPRLDYWALFSSEGSKVSSTLSYAFFPSILVELVTAIILFVSGCFIGIVWCLLSCRSLDGSNFEHFCSTFPG